MVSYFFNSIQFKLYSGHVSLEVQKINISKLFF